MKLFRNLPIRQKLIRIIMLTSAIALVLSVGVFATYDAIRFRSSMIAKLSGMASIIGENSVAALAFDDAEAGRANLATLKSDEHIVAAAIYDAAGGLFVTHRNGAGHIPRYSEANGARMDNGRLSVFRAIVSDNETVGVIYIESDLLEFYERVRSYALVALLALTALLVVVYLLSRHLQHAITDPILELAAKATVVSNAEDYSIRANKTSDDEIGVLVDRFNEMMKQIGERDAALKRAQEELEIRVNDRTTELRREITWRKQTQQQLVAAKQGAEQANVAKSAFLANMSHELRTPLNAIIGYAEMLQEDADGLGQRQLSLDLQKIHGAGHHLLVLINDILDLSKIEAGKMEVLVETIEIPRMIEDIAQTVRPLVAENDNRLTVRCAANVGMLRADSTKLRQSLFNLLSNACKFTEGGEIVLEAYRQTEGAGDWMCFRVSDSGIGMNAAELSRLFQEFTQVDASTTRRHGGTGLGLAITRRFCRLMGGDIEVSSEPLKGSTFTIHLPMQPQRSAALREQPRPAPAQRVEGEPDLQSEGLRPVLIIDDDATDSELLRRHLDKHGFPTVVATNGEEGLRLALEIDPFAITLDVIMPEMSGWDVLGALKADSRLAAVPVILVTVADDDKGRGRALGCVEHLAKPVDHERLVTCLRAIEIEALAAEHEP